MIIEGVFVVVAFSPDIKKHKLTGVFTPKIFRFIFAGDEGKKKAGKSIIHGNS
jgi:hypothetical protein